MQKFWILDKWVIRNTVNCQCLPKSARDSCESSHAVCICKLYISACTWSENKNHQAISLLSIYWHVISIATAESLSKELSSKNSELVSLSQNLVDAIWEDRPTRPPSLVFHLDEKYSGMYSQILFIYGFSTPFLLFWFWSRNHIKGNPMQIKLYKCEKNLKRRRPRLLSWRCLMKWRGCSTYEAQTLISIQVNWEWFLLRKVLNLFS